VLFRSVFNRSCDAVSVAGETKLENLHHLADLCLWNWSKIRCGTDCSASGSCPVSVFGTSGNESVVSTTRQSVSLHHWPCEGDWSQKRDKRRHLLDYGAIALPGYLATVALGGTVENRGNRYLSSARNQSPCKTHASRDGKFFRKIRESGKIW
jgi:hypothetical protein